MREHVFDLESTPIAREILSTQDCVVLVTDHDAFDYGLILDHSSLLVDTRGRFSANSAKVIKA